jgi:hypothetical protein
MTRDQSSHAFSPVDFDAKRVTHRTEYVIPFFELDKILLESKTDPEAIDRFITIWHAAGIVAEYGLAEFSRMRDPSNGREFIAYMFNNDTVEFVDEGLLIRCLCYAIYSENEKLPSNSSPLE